MNSPPRNNAVSLKYTIVLIFRKKNCFYTLNFKFMIMILLIDKKNNCLIVV